MGASKYKTALIGLGKMGAQYAKDPQIAKYYKYSSHIQAINDHPDFECGAQFDQNSNIENQNFQSISDVSENYNPEILVLATPPKGRLEIIKQFKGLKAVVMEKPVSHNLQDAKCLIEYCQKANILLQVNFWRRFDKCVIELKNSLEKYDEIPQSIFVTYGNGLRNNAVHVIDQLRYLFGDIKDIRAISEPKYNGDFPIQEDFNLDLILKLENGCTVQMNALDFNYYREISVDIWTDRRRIEFLQGGLFIRTADIGQHRALKGCNEITHDNAMTKKTGAGTALYNLYENLSQALSGNTKLLSDGKSALENEFILDRAIQ